MVHLINKIYANCFSKKKNYANLYPIERECTRINPLSKKKNSKSNKRNKCDNASMSLENARRALFLFSLFNIIANY